MNFECRFFPETYTVDSAFLNYRYAYDDRGLIVSRSERVIDYREDYKYDNLDRLTGITSGSVGAVSAQQQFSYLPNGNFETNSALGVYAYENNEFGMLKAHAVSEIALTGNNNSPGLHDVTYNFFNQPTKITQANYRLDLFYGANQQRQKMERYFDDVKETTRYYINKHYEQEDDHTTGITRHYHYIYGDYGVVALYTTDVPIGDPSGDPEENMYYIHTDHVGSYCAITDSNKEVVQRNYFDPWGNVVSIHAPNDPGIFIFVKPDNIFQPIESEPFDLSDFPITARGFTGHEHYPFFQIINTNGRLYDPVIGRFFSPDNFVQAPEFTQGFNRYSYCLNNPLKYVDPTGQRWVDFDDWVEDPKNPGKGIYFDKNITTSQEAEDQGLIYRGRTVFAVSDAGHFMYGAQDGRWYDRAPLNPITVSFERPNPIVQSMNAGARAFWTSTPVQLFLMVAPFGGAANQTIRSGSYISKNAPNWVSSLFTKDLAKIYRVFGGEAKATGRYWTPVNPNTVKNYRNAAGLPSENTGRFVIEGRTPFSNIKMTPEGAAPIGTNTGGLKEYLIIDPSKVTIERISGVNPPF